VALLVPEPGISNQGAEREIRVHVEGGWQHDAEAERCYIFGWGGMFKHLGEDINRCRLKRGRLGSDTQVAVKLHFLVLCF